MPNEEELLVPPDDIPQYSWARPSAVDRTLLTPRASSRVITVMMPHYEKRKLAVLIKHPETGELFYTQDGLPFYNIQEEEIFVGFKPKKIGLPGQEIFNIDLTSSYLTEFDVPALRSLISLYSDLQLQIMQGKDRLADLYYIYSKIMGMVDTAKAREGKTARLAKTMITEGTSKQEIIDEFQREQDKKSWLPGKH